MDITKFGLSNFRVFKEHFDFDISPIMVLTGPNNSGKSSLSKALLLLKENQNQINHNTYSTFKLDYFKGEHDLGNHKYTVNTLGENTNFSFTYFLDYKFHIELNNEGKFVYDYKITTGDNKLILSQLECTFNIDIKNIIVYFKDRLAFTQSKQNFDSFNLGKSNSSFLSDSHIAQLEKFIYHLEDFGMKINSICIDLYDCSNDTIDAGKYFDNTLTEEENIEKSIFYNAVFDDTSDYCPDLFKWQENLIFLFCKMTSIELTKDEIHFLIPTSKPEIPKLDSNFFSFSDLIYVNTIKEPLKRAYSRNDISKLKDLMNEQISRDISQFNSKAETNYDINVVDQSKDDPTISNNNGTYECFIQKWLTEFEIGEKLSYGFDEENDIYFIKVDNKSLPEYGLGYGLIIHILLALSNEREDIRMLRVMERMTKNDLKLSFPTTYIIEEPETGLHPAFQSKMAEMIVDAQKKFGINIIIETHSEYFIRKLQSLTATMVLNPGDAVIYYFNNPKKIPINEEQIKKITIDENGSLSDTFGTGFIDEGTNLKFNLLRTLNRQQN